MDGQRGMAFGLRKLKGNGRCHDTGNIIKIIIIIIMIRIIIIIVIIITIILSIIRNCILATSCEKAAPFIEWRIIILFRIATQKLYI